MASKVALLNLRMSDADRFTLKQIARSQGMTVSDLVRAALAPILRPSYETTADTAETTLALPAMKIPYTGKGQHDDFARAAVAARRYEATQSARTFLAVQSLAERNVDEREREQARACGLLLD